VPVYTNIFAPPLPQPRRFVELGRLLRRLVEAWPSPQRVAIIGTGHLSLELGGPRQFGPHGPDPDDDARHGLYNSDKTPRLFVVDTDVGVMYGSRQVATDTSYYWRSSQFLMPNITLFPGDPDGVVPGHMWVVDGLTRSADAMIIRVRRRLLAALHACHHRGTTPPDVGTPAAYRNAPCPPFCRLRPIGWKRCVTGTMRVAGPST
jgi:hypothetical protein